MKLLQKSLLGLLIACTIIAFGGIIPVTDAVVSADSNEIKTISIPYTQSYDADSTRTDDTFKYQIVPVDGAPAPMDCVNGVYYFIVKAKPNGQKVTGTVELRIPFSKSGEYKYNISSFVDEPKEGFKYDNTVYTAHVYVRDSGNTQVVLTAKGSSGKKAALDFSSSYSAKAAADTERTASSPDGNGKVEKIKKQKNGNPDQTAQNDNNGNNANDNNANPTANDNTNDDANAEDEPTTFEKLRDAVLPKADPNRTYWSLVNLIALILTVLMGAILFGRYMGRIDTDRDEYIIRREGKLRLMGIIPAVVTAVVFFSTEDFGDKMGLYDEWTPFMVIATIVQIAICVIVYKVYDGKNNRQIGSASA
jgi:pilin isopeptide linkage protein